MTTLMTRRLGGALVALGLMVAGRAEAAPITFEFEGTVRSSDFGTIPVGSGVTGSYTFDDGLSDTRSNPFNGDYGPVDLTIIFIDGSSVITSTATFFINDNSSGFGTTDEYSVRMDTAPDTLTGSFAGLTWEFGNLHRFDETGAAFSDDSLPLTPPDLASLPGDQSRVYFGDFDVGFQRISFELTSLSIAASDADGDGVADADDNCPDDPNADQTDTDGDDEGDACDADDDNDNVADAADNCPLDANPDQADGDGDDFGDVCDTDDDNDGVIDGADACVPTATGAVVNGDGCAIADLCPCDNAWKNHGAYVSCTARASKEFLDLGLITEAEKDAIVSAAGQSQCGRNN